MSMPTFPDPLTILTREEAVNAILTSIALEETALSHIINAEGEKIQYALEHMKCNSNMRIFLEVNESVSSMLEQINDLQLVLISKLNKVLKCIPQNPVSCDGQPRFEKPCPNSSCPNNCCSDHACPDNSCQPSETCDFESQHNKNCMWNKKH